MYWQGESMDSWHECMEGYDAVCDDCFEKLYRKTRNIEMAMAYTLRRSRITTFIRRRQKLKQEYKLDKHNGEYVQSIKGFKHPTIRLGTDDLEIAVKARAKPHMKFI